MNINTKQEEIPLNFLFHGLNASDQACKADSATTTKKITSSDKQHKEVSIFSRYTLGNPVRPVFNSVKRYLYNHSIPYEDFKALCDHPNAQEAAQQIKLLLSDGSYKLLKKWIVTETPELKIISTSKICPLEYVIEKNNMTIVKQLLCSLQAVKNIFDPKIINLLVDESVSISNKYNLLSHWYIDRIIENGNLELIQTWLTVLKDDLFDSPIFSKAIITSIKCSKHDILDYVLEFSKKNSRLNLRRLSNYYKNNEKPMVIAVANNDIIAVKALLSYGLQANQGDNEHNTVYQAIKNNNIEILEELVKHGAKLNLINYHTEKRTPLATKGKIFIYKRYITPLEYSVLYSNLDTIKWLIHHGANHAIEHHHNPKEYSEKTKCFRSTPLHRAILNNNKEVVELLLTTKASHPRNIAFTAEINYLTAIEYAESLNFRADRTEIIKLLKKHT